MKRNIRMEIAYDGSAYNGWQRQENTSKTIQGTLEAVLSALLNEKIRLHGSGRTDAGVHAREQTANFHTEAVFETQQLLREVNRQLPEDIRILHASEAEDKFHARYSAVAKQYSYTLWTSDVSAVFDRKYLYEIDKPLDIRAMKEAAGCLLGEHDFRSFCSQYSQEKTTVRRMDCINIEQKENKITILYQGNGFLYHMVRILTGTLIEIGMGKREPSSVLAILQEEKRAAAGFTAPPQGLCLEKVFYDERR